MAYRVGIVGSSSIVIKPPAPALSSVLRDEVYTSHVGSVSTMPQVELAAVCDIDPAALARFKSIWGERWPETRTYADHRAMLDAERLDILTVATSDHRHARIVIDGAASGVRGILCEKPIATSLEDADAMIAACERAGVKMSINHTRRWSPLLHKVRQALNAGVVGAPAAMSAVLGGPRAMLFRNGTHFLDALCFFAQSEPVRASALLEAGFDHWERYHGDGGKLPQNDPGATGTILFANGLIATFRGVKRTAPYSHFELCGSEGVIRFESDSISAELIRPQPQPAQPLVTTIRPEQYSVHGMVAAYHELIDLIERGGESVSSPREARKPLRITLAFLDSHQNGSQMVDVPT